VQKNVTVERLAPDQLESVRRLLIDLHLEEQPHFEGRPQLTEAGADLFYGRIEPNFLGENVIFAVRDDGGALAAFCWVVLFDPGTGLEGEVAEVFVRPEHRGRGMGEALLDRAIRLFRDRMVTIGYVWTRADNEGAKRLYRRVGFSPTEQLVLTWYPEADRRHQG
jgi:ribosomal-protein-alanine N-acetyltransferase